MVETIGFDGFRFDFVKGYAPWMVQSHRRAALPEEIGATTFMPSASASAGTTNVPSTTGSARSTRYTDNPVSAFDFPLHYRLKDLCDTYGFSLQHSGRSGNRGPGHAVASGDLRRQPRHHSRSRQRHQQRQAAGLQLHSDPRRLSQRLLDGLVQLRTGARPARRTELPRWSQLTSNMPAARPKCSTPTTIFTSCSARARARSRDWCTC